MRRGSLVEIVALVVLTAACMGSYEVARPASEALFLDAYGKDALPIAWLLVALSAAVVVFVYNRFAARVRILRLMAVCIGLAMGLLCGLQAALRAHFPGATYALYIWKDVYVVVLVEIFWSFANMVYPLKSARWLYGLFCASGSVGSGLSTRGLRWFVEARSVDGYDATLDGLWLVIPLLGLGLLATLVLSKTEAARIANRMLHQTLAPEACPPVTTSDHAAYCEVALQSSSDHAAHCEEGAEAASKKADRTGLRALFGSPYLLWIVGMVLAMQLLSTLVDYRFNDLVASQFEGAARTAAISEVYEWISYGALVMQLLSGLLLKVLGLGPCLLALPAVMFVGVLAFGMWPLFRMGAIVKAVGKILDYSLARSTKEILYLPLSYEEKTQGKALCDMLGYRLAKGLTALMLQGLILAGIAVYALWFAGGFALCWLFCAVVCLRRYHQRVDREA